MPALRRLMSSFAVAGLAASAAAQISYYNANLTGDQEVPPVATAGRGFAIVRLEEPANTVRIFAQHEALTGTPTAAHLHVGLPGTNGGAIVGLTAGPAGTYTGTGTLIPGLVTALKGGGTYINVHTAVFPGGEIRGQVLSPTTTRFTGRIEGSQEVPPNASTANGTVVAFLHEPGHRLVYEVASRGLVNVTAAHFHEAAPGVNGPVRVTLNGTAGHYCGVATLTDAQTNALRAGNFYTNIHTAAFPGGEIRGQLRPDQGDHFVASLDGAQEVPPNPSPGRGSGCLVIDAGGTAALDVAFAGLLAPTTAAHIHFGAIGVNGPVVVPLVTGGPGRFTATFAPTAAMLSDLRAGNWYINVHTTMFPGGEIRGQLLPASLPTVFGGGCPGSNGERPAIGVTGFACLGTRSSFDLHGALPSSVAILALGTNRDSSGATPLPAPFAVAGLPAPCFFLIDPMTTNVVAVDAHGCADWTLALPMLPSLRGAVLHGQWFVIDAAANPAGLVASNAVSSLIQ